MWNSILHQTRPVCYQRHLRSWYLYLSLSISKVHLILTCCSRLKLHRCIETLDVPDEKKDFEKLPRDQSTLTLAKLCFEIVKYWMKSELDIQVSTNNAWRQFACQIVHPSQAFSSASGDRSPAIAPLSIRVN